MATRTFPINNFSGVQVFGPEPIAAGLTRFRCSFDGSTPSMQNPALRLKVELDISLDDGASWAFNNQTPDNAPFPCIAEMEGGAVDKHGVPLAEYDVSCNLPHPESTHRQLRFRGTVSGAPLTTVATFTIT